MKKLILIVGLLLVAWLIGQAAKDVISKRLDWDDDPDTKIQRYMEKTVEIISKDLPKIIDKNTTAIGIRVSPTKKRTMIQDYQLNNMFIENVDSNAIEEAKYSFETYMQNHFCTSPQMNRQREDNIVLEYSYKDPNGNFLFAFEVGNYGC